MEFRFNLNEIFPEPIVEVGNTLIPPGFTGDKRALWDTQSKITQIVNSIGEASATAQGLSKPITTADRLRNSEHTLYLLVDHSANNGKGAVTGMLKTGEKGLYVFDREGHHYQVSPPCVLDFYVHESRQRSGFGKRLFEYMLQREKIDPVKMAIDRPSDKFLGFLNKHYGLSTPVKQMNNYVVFDEFFPKSAETSRSIEEDKSHTPTKKQSANGLQAGFPSSPYGRYAARRPPCSMGQIIHNDNPVIKRNAEPTGVRSEPMNNIQGQQQMYYSQIPAWQTSQSVPNMPYTHYQQYLQNSTTPQSSNGGDYQSNTPSQTLSHAQQQLPIPTQNQPVQNQMYHNYALSQGDATSQIYQRTLQNAPHQMQGQQYIPVQYSNVNVNQNTIDQTQQDGRGQVQTENNLNSPQTMQNYNPGAPSQNYNLPINPDMQHYYQSQEIPNSSLAQSYAIYPTKGLMPTTNQVSNQPTTLPPFKEPLIPQHFDGTVRRIPQVTQSVPAQMIDLPQAVHSSPSAPIGQFQQQSVLLQGTTTAPSKIINQNLPTNSPYQTTITGSQSILNQQQLHQTQSTLPTEFAEQTAYQNQATSSIAQAIAPNINQYQNNGAQLPEQGVAYSAQPNYTAGQQNQIPSDQTMSPINQQVTQQPVMHENIIQNQKELQVMDQTKTHNQLITGNALPTYYQPNIDTSAPKINVLPSPATLQPSQQNITSAQSPIGNMQHQIRPNHPVQPDYSTFQNIIGNGSQQNRFMQNTPFESNSAPAVNVTANSGELQRKVKTNEEVDISKGYPPQLLPSPVAARPPIVIRN